MLVGDINLEIQGLSREYTRFIEKYGSSLNSLWVAQFNKEAIANRSDKHFDILQYIDGYLLSLLIKQDFLLGQNTKTTSINIDTVRTQLRNNNISLDDIFKQISLVEKVFCLKVVSDEVEETVLARSINTTESTATTYSVTTEDNLDVFYCNTGNIVYDDVDADLLLLDNDINVTLQLIGKADDNIIAIYLYESGQIYLERDGTSLKVIVTDKVNYKTYTIEGTFSSATWLFGLFNVKIATDSVEVVSFINGEYRGYSLVESVSSTSVSNVNRYIINNNTTGNNRYHKIAWYRGQFAKQDIFNEYLYYKNIITI